MAFTAQDVQGPALSHRRRDDGLQEGAPRPTDGDIEAAKQTGSARRASPPAPSTATRENAEGRGRLRSSATASARSSPSSRETDFVAAQRATSRSRPTDAGPSSVAAEGPGCRLPSAQAASSDLKIHAEGEHRARRGRPVARPATATIIDSYLSTSRVAWRERRARSVAGGDNNSPTTSPCTSPFARPKHLRRDDVPAEAGRRPSATTLEAITRNEGKPERGVAARSSRVASAASSRTCACSTSRTPRTTSSRRSVPRPSRCRQLRARSRSADPPVWRAPRQKAPAGERHRLRRPSGEAMAEPTGEGSTDRRSTQTAADIVDIVGARHRARRRRRLRRQHLPRGVQLAKGMIRLGPLRRQAGRPS